MRKLHTSFHSGQTNLHFHQKQIYLLNKHLYTFWSALFSREWHDAVSGRCCLLYIWGKWPRLGRVKVTAGKVEGLWSNIKCRTKKWQVCEKLCSFKRVTCWKFKVSLCKILGKCVTTKFLEKIHTIIFTRWNSVIWLGFSCFKLQIKISLSHFLYSSNI